MKFLSIAIFLCLNAVYVYGQTPNVIFQPVIVGANEEEPGVTSSSVAVTMSKCL